MNPSRLIQLTMIAIDDVVISLPFVVQRVLNREKAREPDQARLSFRLRNPMGV
jgi:hypothetical protein